MVRRSTLLLSATLGFGLLYVAATVVLGSTPDAGVDGQALAAWFRDHDGHVRAWMWLLTLSAPLFATFAALVRTQLPAPHRDVFFFGAIAFAAETAVQGWLWAGMAWHASQLQPATARTLLDVASLWGARVDEYDGDNAGACGPAGAARRRVASALAGPRRRRCGG
jgi:hypothetical protein